MASLDQMNEGSLPADEGQDAGEPVSPEQVEIVTRLAIKMIRDGGALDTLRKSLTQSQDPAQVVGQFIVQMISSLLENLGQKMDLDPRVFLVPDGFLDNILDYLEKALELPAEFSDQVEGEVLEMIKALAQGEQKPAPAQGPSLDQGAPGMQQPQQMPPQGGPGLGGM